MDKSSPGFRAILPIPPSANHLFATISASRRVRSKAYKAWTTEANWTLKRLRATPVIGRWQIIIAAGIVPRRDLDNLIKPVLDLLSDKKGLRLVQDDIHCRRISVFWSNHVDKYQVEISVLGLEAEHA